MNITSVAAGITYGDLHHMDEPEGIAVYMADSSDGVIVVDPGPTSCAGALREVLAAKGAKVYDVRHVILTHIHLDHAGGVGGLVREVPKAKVYVHRRGAGHVIDPSRLLESARRIYGTDMDRLWGDVLPVPSESLVVLDGNEQLVIGGRKWRAAYTPGHAIHHLAYLDEHEGVAFTGDVAGEGTAHGTPPLPVAPPPDIDLESWRPSIDTLLGWKPTQLALTHFGTVSDPPAHLEGMWSRLVEWSEHVRLSLEASASDEARADAFCEAELERVTAGLSETARRLWKPEAPIKSSWYGLARYWRKRREAVSANS